MLRTNACIDRNGEPLRHPNSTVQYTHLEFDGCPENTSLKEPIAILLDMATQEIELTEVIDYTVDLRTPDDLSRYFRSHVLKQAQVLYERA